MSHTFQEFVDGVSDAVLVVFRWVMLIIAIIIGTFLGLLLFVWFVAHRVDNEFKQLLVESPLFSTTLKTGAPDSPTP